MWGIHTVFQTVMWAVLFFYLINALHSDRRDRSVLFWKSMPVSELHSVLAKLCVTTFVIFLMAVLLLDTSGMPDNRFLGSF